MNLPQLKLIKLLARERVREIEYIVFDSNRDNKSKGLKAADLAALLKRMLVASN